jgi:hypothetical protein
MIEDHLSATVESLRSMMATELRDSNTFTLTFTGKVTTLSNAIRTHAYSQELSEFGKTNTVLSSHDLQSLYSCCFNIWVGFNFLERK